MQARRWGFRAAAVLLGLLIPLGGTETYLRIMGLGGGFYEPDPVLGARLQPNGKGRWRAACYDVPIRINSQGLRDVEHSLEKPQGVRRIAVLGDSIAEALQVPLEQTFARRLNALLNPPGGSPRTEVINFGVSGYVTDQMYVMLKTRALDYRPDVVVLAFTIGNDVRNNTPSLEGRVSSYPKPFFRLTAGGSLEPIPFAVAAPLMAGATGKVKAVLRHLRVYDLAVAQVRARASLRSVFAKLGLLRESPAATRLPAAGAPGPSPADLAYLDFEVYRREPTAEWGEAWRIAEALVRAVRDESRAMGARFLLGPVPGAIELATPDAIRKVFPAYRADLYDLAGPRERLRQLAEGEQMEYVSFFDAFANDLRSRGAPLADLFLWCDGHLTARGHEVVAQVIADRLRQPDQSGRSFRSQDTPAGVGR